MANETVAVLRLSLLGQTVGYLAGYSAHDRNVFTLDPAYIEDPNRFALTLSFTNPEVFARHIQVDNPWVTRQKLHPVLSNLLPEGALRDLLTQQLKVHRESEFKMLSWLGMDLPGALVATPVPVDEVPRYALEATNHAQAEVVEATPHKGQFSLAGVQVKFSMREDGARYMMGSPHEPGDWIIKTPSPVHASVPFNEYTAMGLAQIVGVDIPDIKLVDLKNVHGLPDLNLPGEQFAYAIRRFDRQPGGVRVHTEDFAQVLYSYAHSKYRVASYDQIGKLLYQQSARGQKDAVQLAIRLLANIYLANGDAHLKNFSLIYPDGRSPQLSPAYDIVTTKVFMANEAQYALNMAKTKYWFDVSMEHFKRWAEYGDIPWNPVRRNLQAVVDKARELWPKALDESPMADNQKAVLRQHWRQLHADFRID